MQGDIGNLLPRPLPNPSPQMGEGLLLPLPSPLGGEGSGVRAAWTISRNPLC